MEVINFIRESIFFILRKDCLEEAPLEGGKKLYMLIYHMMDLITFICPALRKRISEYYIDKAQQEAF